MVNLLGQDLERYMEDPAGTTKAHLHIYGKKEAKTNRKMGHITYVGPNLEAVHSMIEQDSHRPKTKQMN